MAGTSLARTPDPAPTTSRPELDPDVVARIQSVTLAGQRTVAVPDALLPLFPAGGLPRGIDVAVSGPGAWSLAMAMWAAALGPDGWLAVVGAPDLNLVAAAALGVRLDRVLVVETPSTGQWATVVAALLEVVDIVAVAPTAGAPRATIGRRDARRLLARARERESILFHLDGAAGWPEACEIVLTAQQGQPWEGLGWGHGYLRQRVLQVDGAGRRAHFRNRSVSVALPALDGRLAPVESPGSGLAPVVPLHR
jgi:hypothetical protein